MALHQALVPHGHGMTAAGVHAAAHHDEQAAGHNRPQDEHQAVHHTAADVLEDAHQGDDIHQAAHRHIQQRHAGDGQAAPQEDEKRPLQPPDELAAVVLRGDQLQGEHAAAVLHVLERQGVILPCRQRDEQVQRNAQPGQRRKGFVQAEKQRCDRHRAQHQLHQQRQTELGEVFPVQVQ